MLTVPHVNYSLSICVTVGVISSGTPTSEVLPDLKEFPEPPLDLADSVPVEDPMKSKCCAISD